MENESKEWLGKGPELSKTFRPTDRDDVREKVFLDHSAKPPRGYPTGELYRLVTDEDWKPAEDEEYVVVYMPEDFARRRYRRISPLDSCFFPKPADEGP